MCDNLIELFRCPNCGVDLSSDLNCKRCAKRYSKTEEGIYDLVFDEERLDEREMTNKLVDLIREKGLRELQKRQQEKMTEEIKQAKQACGAELGKRLMDVEGYVLEIATGFGGAGNLIVDEKTKPVLTDLNLDILKMKDEKILKGEIGEDYHMVRCDAKALPFRDRTFDHVVSLGGLSNIPNTSEVLSEMYRVLKDGGKITASPLFVEEGSEAAERAREFGVENGVLKENLMNILSGYEFKELDLDVVSSATAVDDGLNILQIEGVKHHYSLLTAEK